MDSNSLNISQLREISAQQAIEITRLSDENSTLREVIAALEKEADDLVDIPLTLSHFPRPFAYASSEDIAKIVPGEDILLPLNQDVVPRKRFYEPLYLHPQGAELERWIRLAINWQTRMEKVEHELFRANYELAQHAVGKMGRA